MVVNLSMFNLIRYSGAVLPFAFVKWPSATSTKITGEVDFDVIIKSLFYKKITGELHLNVIIKYLFSRNFSFIKIGLEIYCMKKLVLYLFSEINS